MSKGTVTILHQEAMALAEQASLESLRGNSPEALILLRQAFEKERAAADVFADSLSLEPTRSVLHRSAASLALECGEVRDAEKLIARALSGNPPDEIAAELRDLLEEVYFQRHLEVRGIVLAPEEFQVSITGESVGFGVAQSEVFLSRLQDLEKLVYRTAERKNGNTFRDRGKAKEEITRKVQLFVSVPRAASFAISVRIGHNAQLMLDGPTFPETIITELLDCLDLFNSKDLEALSNRIPEEPYLRNFLGLAKRIAPDGRNVNMVGFTMQRRGKTRTVALKTSGTDGSQFAEMPRTTDTTAETVRLIGNLRFANALRKSRDEIRLVDAAGQPHKVLVPPGMMDDIVRPLWHATVQVIGKREGKWVRLEDIQKVENSDE